MDEQEKWYVIKKRKKIRTQQKAFLHAKLTFQYRNIYIISKGYLKMKNVVYYDVEVDDLLISCKTENEKVKKNFMFDDFVISVTEEGKIVGLEIRNVSRFLEENGINPELLTRFKEVELNITPKSSFVNITLSFDIPDKDNIIRRKIPITHIPLEAI